MKRTYLLTLLVLAFSFAPDISGVRAQSEATSRVSLKQDDVKAQPWPDKLWMDVFREVDRSGTQLTNVLFDQIDEFDLLDLGENNNSLQVSVKRSVFDNQDVLNTYTVNDQFAIDIGRSATEFSIPLVPSVATPLNFNLGINGKLKVNHIRQVYSSKYPSLPKVEELEKITEEEDQIHDREAKKWWEFDPSWRPRLSKFWNPAVALYRIPWTKDGLKKINAGDLISYSASGYIAVGLESGFVPLRLAPGVDLSIGVGAQVYTKGEYRITLLKESDRYVRVKLTKVRSFGQGGTIGARTNEIQVMEGFFIFEGKKLEYEVTDQKITVVPFKFNIDHEVKRQFDLGYRFDMEDPVAEAAFEKAMRGNFKAADELSESGSGVTHILTRTAREKRNANSFQLGLKWLYNFGKGKERKDLWATIEKPDGTKEIFKSSFQLAKSWTTLWGTGEKENFLFSTVFDQTAYLNNEENSFQLVSEALYEDVSTSGKEMRQYIHDVQSVLGGRTVLPELPALVPKEKSDRFRPARYKRSSFYFGQYFSQKQVMKFLMTDSRKAWEIAYKSFDYIKEPNNRWGKVKRFYRHWMRLQKIFQKEMTPEEMIDALQELRMLFRYQARAIHAMRAILVSLDGEEIDYFLSATNNSFGRITFRGRVQTNAERLLQMADETVDFENRVGQSRTDLNAKINDFKVEQLEDQRLKIKFSLPKDTKYIYFKVMRTSGWKKVKTIRDMIYVNKGRFKEGANEWTIGPDSTDSLDEAIWGSLKENEFYTIQVSASLDAQSWGRVESSRFKFKPIQAPEVKPAKEEKPQRGKGRKARKAKKDQSDEVFND